MRRSPTLPSFAALLCALALLAPSAPAQQPQPEEKFEAIDPYTRGGKEELAKLGYESFGPFHFAEGIETKDVEELLGSTRVLWVETAHFKLGSTLPIYECPPDDLEKQRLKEELARLAKRLPRLRSVPAKLDPWLRLHLYAQRLEEQYADFEARFGLAEKEFEPGTPGALGPGRYLGSELKYTVLLTQKSAPIARAAKRWLGYDEQGYYRGLLPGGTWFLGSCSEMQTKLDCKLDTGLHAIVAYALAQNLCDGFRGTRRERPLWWKHGLGLFYSRRVEERWSMHVEKPATGSESDSWRWEPRVSALVANNFVPAFDEMLAWPAGGELSAPQHMSTWSRVAFLLGQEKADLRGFLMAISEPIEPSLGEKERSAALVEAGKRALKAGFGKTPAELDAAWRKWVLRKYPKR